MTAAQAAKVDWLNATFPKPLMSAPGFVALLARMLGREVSAVEGGGMLGFETAVKLYGHHGRDKSALGFLAFGGESQNGRWLLSLSGTGCGFVRDWQAVADLLEDLGAKITRLDLAVEFLDGHATVDDALNLYVAGGFTGGGNAPKCGMAGDWLSGAGGRTFYVGKAQNGKMLRAYEKGRQLGDEASEWVRFEVQLGSRDRVIPFEALTDRDAYFAGCYPCLDGLVEAAAKSIPTQQAKGATTVSHLLHHFRRTYGKFVDALSTHLKVDSTDLVQEIRVIGLPKRLDYFSAVAGVEWADVLARIKGRS